MAMTFVIKQLEWPSKLCAFIITGIMLLKPTFNVLRIADVKLIVFLT